MNSQGSFVTTGLIALALSIGSGCKKDEPPKPDPATQTAASARASKLNARANMGASRMDPQVMKDYRLDVCYYGSISLMQARDAYLASLGKDEPSEKKIPNLGVPGGSTPEHAASPAASGSAAAAGSAKAAKPAAPAPSGSAAAAASASAAAPTPPMPDRRPDPVVRLPHERNARACTAAVALKEPAMGDVDVAVGAYAPFAVELAKDITAAAQYYYHEEYKKDGFAHGKELDKKLREQFAKLNELHDKLGGTLADWRRDHPLDTSKMDEGEKLARAAIDDARDAFMLVVARKADGDAWKAALDKVTKSSEALKTYAGAHAAEPWAKLMVAPTENFVKVIKESKVTADKGFDSDSYLSAVTAFTGLVEARQRSISRSMMTRKEVAPATPPAAPADPHEQPAH